MNVRRQVLQRQNGFRSKHKLILRFRGRKGRREKRSQRRDGGRAVWVLPVVRTQGKRGHVRAVARAVATSRALLSQTPAPSVPAKPPPSADRAWTSGRLSFSPSLFLRPRP